MAGFFFSDTEADPASSTPGAVERRRRLAEQLIKDGTSTAPVPHWTVGLARMLQAGIGAHDLRQADAQEKAGRDSANQILAKFLSSSPSTAPAVPPSEQPATPADPARIVPPSPPTQGHVSADPALSAPPGSGTARDSITRVFAKVDAPDVQPANTPPAVAAISAATGAGGLSERIAPALGEFSKIFPNAVQTSGYRDPARNAAVGGAKGSAHMSGDALDFSVRGMTEEQKRAVVDWWSQKGATGIGYYPGSDSIHVDMRPGPNRAWGPNYSRTSLGDTPEWFRSTAMDHLNGGRVQMASLGAGDPQRGVMAFAGHTATDAGTPTATGHSPAVAGQLGTTSSVSNIRPAGAPQTTPQRIAQVLTSGAPAPAARPDNSALVALLTNQWATPAQQQIAAGLLQRQMAGDKIETIDLGDRFGLLNQRGQITGYIPKGRAPRAPMAVGPDQRLVDPDTGREIVSASGTKAPVVQRIKQEDGSEVAVQWDPTKNAWTPLAAPEGGNPVRSTMPKLTEGQSKDVGFYQRGVEANNALTPEAEKALTNASDTALQNVPSVLGINPGRAIQSPEFKTAHNSSRNFLAVILRKDTGAAVTPQEFAEYTPLFIPQPSDTPELLAQKRQARATALQAIKDGLGNVGAVLERVMAERKAAAPQAGPAAGQPVRVSTPDEARRLPKGTPILLPDGTTGVVP
jgi:hypothetical protein